VLIYSIGPEPLRKRRRARASPPAGDQEIIPQIDDADLQMNVDMGNGGVLPMATFI